MSHLTREDGEQFVVPAYRDVLAAKSQNLLKREILLLSSNYGEYITLHRRGQAQYEVAFSSESGYLLGESIWHQFKRPADLVYCELLQDRPEAILVIVKGSSVYLDGVFPVDSIPEELIIFQTQQNNFEIYTYGEVPLSQTPVEGKFSFEASSVKSFKTLDKPTFPTLPLVRAYHLELVEPVLRANGIGVFPLKQVIGGMVAMGLLWMAYSYVTTHKKELPTIVYTAVVSPYESYNNTLMSPQPVDEIAFVVASVNKLTSLPGWEGGDVGYAKGIVTIGVKSFGGTTAILYEWAQKNGATVNLTPTGYSLTMKSDFSSRDTPKQIYGLENVIAGLIDKIALVLPGNHLRVSDFTTKGTYKQANLEISFTGTSPAVLLFVAEQLKDLPLVLIKMGLSISSDGLSGTITLLGLGN